MFLASSVFSVCFSSTLGWIFVFCTAAQCPIPRASQENIFFSIETETNGARARSRRRLCYGAGSTEAEVPTAELSSLLRSWQRKVFCVAVVLSMSCSSSVTHEFCENRLRFSNIVCICQTPLLFQTPIEMSSSILSNIDKQKTRNFSFSGSDKMLKLKSNDAFGFCVRRKVQR